MTPAYINRIDVLLEIIKRFKNNQNIGISRNLILHVLYGIRGAHTVQRDIKLENVYKNLAEKKIL